MFRDIAIDGSDPTKFSKVGALLNFACEMTTELIVQKFNLARTPLLRMHMWQKSRISEILIVGSLKLYVSFAKDPYKRDLYSPNLYSPSSL